MEANDGPDAGMGSGSSMPMADAGIVNTGPFALDCAVTENQMTTMCLRPSAVDPGAIGSGPPINGKLRGGFVDGNRLIAAVSYSNTGGYLVAVDLATGERSVISGTYNDAANGPKTTGTGLDWGAVQDVQPGPDGWYAVSSLGVFKVDPATGNRTRIIDQANTATQCTIGTAKVAPRTDAIAVGPDKSVFLSLSKTGVGVGLVAVKAGVCRVVTLTGGTTTVGSGPTFSSGNYFRTIRFRDGKIWALEFVTKSLLTIDPTAGARVRISASGVTKLGTGDIDVGSGHMGFPTTGTNPVYTTIYDVSNRLFNIPIIDPTTGNRTSLLMRSGPATKSGQDYPPLWVHPTKPWLVVGLDDSLVQIDIASGNSITLSR